MNYRTLITEARAAFDDINRSRNNENRTKDENGNIIISIPIEDSTKDYLTTNGKEFIKDYWEESGDYEYLGAEFDQYPTGEREDQWFVDFTLKEREYQD